MRILHLVSYSLYSGPLPSTLALALAQRRLGHTVWLAYDTQRGNFNNYEEAAAPHVEPARLTPPISLSLSSKASLRQGWRDLRALKQFCRAQACDVVHTHLSHDHTLVALLGRIPVRRMRTLHAARSLQPRFGQRWLTRHADGYIVRCAQHRDTLVYGLGLSPAQVAVIDGSIDVSHFAPRDSTTRIDMRLLWGVPAHVPLLGHVALLARRGQEELLHALTEVPAVHVLFVGRGERELALRQLAVQLNVAGRVHFAGYMQGPALVDTYAALDACFLAQAGNDASARAALEAMAMALPIVVVPDGALAELGNPRWGYTVARRTPAAIAESLRTWAADVPAGQRRGAQGRHHVSQTRQIDAEAHATLEHYARAQPGCDTLVR